VRKAMALFNARTEFARDNDAQKLFRSVAP
jgi:hypothetical protein